MRGYIHAVLNRYQNKIPWWDVVNETIDDAQDNGNPFNIRDCFSFRKLGGDYVKYALIFAHEVDPTVKLYYDDYNIEDISEKSNNALALVQWLKSQGVPIHRIRFQWHIGVSASVQPGDQYYQNAQRLIDNGFDFMVTELDVAVPMHRDGARDPYDIHKQGLIYRDLVKYLIYFAGNCPALITWSFNALPIHWNYQPKFAYWQMQDELSRILPNGIYCLSAKLKSDSCLDVQDIGESGRVYINEGNCNGSSQNWNVTWQGDGTYCVSPLSDGT